MGNWQRGSVVMPRGPEPLGYRVRQRLDLLSSARRVVVKLGTAVLTHGDGSIALSRCYGFVESLAALKRGGREVLVVSSGAVGLGASTLGLARPVASLPMRQACAAVGQGRLMALYAEAFERLGIIAAQVLLTRDDFTELERYQNLRRAVTQLIELGVVPIINENDTVATDELELKEGEATFGDNDGLSALVAGKVNAHLLLILTDVDGLYTADPRDGGKAKLIPLVEQVTPEIESLAGGANVGRGGMRSKVSAAAFAARAGCATIIADGTEPGIIDRLFAGESTGTLFLPRQGGSSVDSFTLLHGPRAV